MTQPLRVMTFNLRFAGDPTPNSWDERRPLVSEMLTVTKPDVIGTQEGLYPQIKDLQSDLRDYGWIGQGREGGSGDEFMAIFFRRDRFEPIEFDYFWLSDTPKLVGSRSWGNKHPRLVAWVKLRDQTSHQTFVFLTTHLDNAVQEAREKAATAIRRYTQFDGATPMLLVGDFNADAGKNKAYDLLVEPDAFFDTWLEAETRGEQSATYHEFNGVQPDQPRIDWILRKGSIKTQHAEVITFNRNGVHPSDHFPVLADVRIV